MSVSQTTTFALKTALALDFVGHIHVEVLFILNLERSIIFD